VQFVDVPQVFFSSDTVEELEIGAESSSTIIINHAPKLRKLSIPDSSKLQVNCSLPSLTHLTFLKRSEGNRSGEFGAYVQTDRFPSLEMIELRYPADVATVLQWMPSRPFSVIMITRDSKAPEYDMELAEYMSDVLVPELRRFAQLPWARQMTAEDTSPPATVISVPVPPKFVATRESPIITDLPAPDIISTILWDTSSKSFPPRDRVAKQLSSIGLDFQHKNRKPCAIPTRIVCVIANL
jgi:hypothetical protein